MFGLNKTLTIDYLWLTPWVSYLSNLKNKHNSEIFNVHAFEW